MRQAVNALFAQAGQVIAVEAIKARKSGASKAFAFVITGEQSEADKAVSMFNAYSLSNYTLKVSPAKPSEPRGASGATLEP